MRGPHLLQDDIGGNLEQGVGNKKYLQRYVIAVALEFEIRLHACNFGIAEICAVQKRGPRSRNRDTLVLLQRLRKVLNGHREDL
jgi:hypothetical protein